MMIADSGTHNNDNLNDVDQLMEVDEGIAANDETDKENNSAIAQTINGNSQDLLVHSQYKSPHLIPFMSKELEFE